MAKRGDAVHAMRDGWFTNALRFESFSSFSEIKHSERSG